PYIRRRERAPPAVEYAAVSRRLRLARARTFIDSRRGARMGVDAVLPVVLIISIFSLVVAGALARQVLSADAGKPEMRGISDAIREGAEAFLRRQYRTIAMLAVVAAAVIFGFYFYNRGVKNIAEMGSA